MNSLYISDTSDNQIKPSISNVFRRLQKVLASGEEDGRVHEMPFIMITKVTAKPNPFSTTITLDISCDQSRHVIVRMTEKNGPIIKLFSWYLMKGTNVTAIHELKCIGNGNYVIDILDQEGVVLYSSELCKG